MNKKIKREEYWINFFIRDEAEWKRQQKNYGRGSVIRSVSAMNAGEKPQQCYPDVSMGSNEYTHT